MTVVAAVEAPDSAGDPAPTGTATAHPVARAVRRLEIVRVEAARGRVEAAHEMTAAREVGGGSIDGLPARRFRSRKWRCPSCLRKRVWLPWPIRSSSPAARTRFSTLRP